VKEFGKVGKTFGTVGKPTAVGKAIGLVGKGANAAPSKPLEEELQAEVKEFDAAFSKPDGETMGEMIKRVAAQLDAEISTDYWCCLVFQTREQLDAYLSAIGWDADGDGCVYLSGTKLARMQNIALPPAPPWKEAKVKGAWAPFALKPGER
jgi:hypothetical protein